MHEHLLRDATNADDEADVSYETNLIFDDMSMYIRIFPLRKFSLPQ